MLKQYYLEAGIRYLVTFKQLTIYLINNYIMIQSKPQSLKRKNSTCVKKETANNTKSTFVESFKGYFTNISYGLQGFKLARYFSNEGNNAKDQNQNGKVFILGEQASIKQSQTIHQDIIWFTYKKNINISSSIHSDVGWGCLIRVAQMVLAHSLKKYFYLVQKKIQKNYIITPFLEERGSQFKYNLHKFIQTGAKMWKLKAGQWYSMTQVATILQELHCVSPLKGSQNLKVKVYNQTVNINQLLEIFQLPICKCETKKINCIFCQSIKDSLKKSYFQKYLSKSQRQTDNCLLKKHLLLIVTTKLGQKTIDKTNFKILLQLMSLPIFNGCMGGVPNKARFLTGRHQDKISYLDPHYVQCAVDQMSLNKKIQVFQCKELRYMQRQELDPQMALCFYLSRQTDLQMLIQAIDKVKSLNGKLPFLKYDWNNETQFQVLADQDHSTKSRQLKQNFQDLQESLSDISNNQSMQSSFLAE